MSTDNELVFELAMCQSFQSQLFQNSVMTSPEACPSIFKCSAFNIPSKILVDSKITVFAVIFLKLTSNHHLAFFCLQVYLPLLILCLCKSNHHDSPFLKLSIFIRPSSSFIFKILIFSFIYFFSSQL